MKRLPLVLILLLLGLQLAACSLFDEKDSGQAAAEAYATVTAQARQIDALAATQTATPTTQAPTVAPSPTPSPTQHPPSVADVLGEVAPSLPTATSTASAVEDINCRLDKVSTINELLNGGPQRIEVGGHGRQHVDYYPTRGVLAVSYLVPAIPNPEGMPAIWVGYGSIWEAPKSPECDMFDWITDATIYATARLDSGHSGLVVDLRGSEAEVVANVMELSEGEIQDLLAKHRASQVEDTRLTPVSEDPTTPVAAPAACDGVRADHNPVVSEAWHPNQAGGFTIVNFWSNMPGVDQAERKLFLEPGENPGLYGGGSSWVWPASCESEALDAFASNSLPLVTLGELDALGLVVD